MKKKKKEIFLFLFIITSLIIVGCEPPNNNKTEEDNSTYNELTVLLLEDDDLEDDDGGIEIFADDFKIKLMEKEEMKGHNEGKTIENNNIRFNNVKGDKKDYKNYSLEIDHPNYYYKTESLSFKDEDVIKKVNLIPRDVDFYINLYIIEEFEGEEKHFIIPIEDVLVTLNDNNKLTDKEGCTNKDGYTKITHVKRNTRLIDIVSIDLNEENIRKSLENNKEYIMGETNETIYDKIYSEVNVRFSNVIDIGISYNDKIQEIKDKIDDLKEEKENVELEEEVQEIDDKIDDLKEEKEVLENYNEFYKSFLVFPEEYPEGDSFYGRDWREIQVGEDLQIILF